MSSRGELEEVEAVNGSNLDTRKVAEGLDDAIVFSVDDERPSSLDVASVAELSLAGAELARVGDLDDVVVGFDRLEQGNGLLGLGQALNRVVDDKGNLLDLLNSVSSSEEQRRDGSGSQGGGYGVSLLLLVGLDEPSSPQPGRGKHVTAPNHVTEGGLARSVCTTTADARDTGDGATGTPGLGRRLMTGVAGDGVWLSLVLGHVLCDNLDRRELRERSVANDSWGGPAP